MTFEMNGTDGSLTIGEVASMATKAMEGQDGGPVEISGHPLAVAPGNPALAGRSEHMRFNDHGFSWELAGKNAFTSSFQYAG